MKEHLKYPVAHDVYDLNDGTVGHDRAVPAGYLIVTDED